MSLKRLKEFFRNKYLIKVIAGIVAFTLVGGTGVGVSTVYGQKITAERKAEIEKETEEVKDNLEESINDMFSSEESLDNVDKDETVYIITDAAGNAQETIVSEWLKNNDKKKTIDDVSNLSDIENVKGDETYKENADGTITWQADGKDIYYTGTTTEKPPITQKVTYYLDGKEVTPEEIAGKTGKVKIKYEYENNTSATETVDGVDYDVKVPFVVISAVILDCDCDSLNVTNGRIVSDGNKQVIIGYSMPGLRESLESGGEKVDIDIPESFEVECDAKDFAVTMSLSVAAHNALSSLSDNSIDLGDVNSDMDELSDAMEKLTDGGDKLADGAGDLKDGAKKLNDGTDTLTDGTDALADGAGDLQDGMGTLKSSIKKYTDGVDKIKDGSKTLADGAKTVDTYVNKLADGYTALLDKTESAAKQYKAGADAIFESSEKAQGALASLIGYESYGAALETIESTTQQMIATTASTLESAANGDKTLAGAASSLKSLAKKDYVSADKAGNYKIESGFADNVNTAVATINQVQSAVETAATDALTAAASATDEKTAKQYTKAAATAYESAGALAAASKTLAGEASAFDSTKSAFDGAADTVASFTADGSKEDIATKVCTYFGYSGAAEALASINQGLADSGVTTDGLSQIAAGADSLATGAGDLAAGLKKLAKNNDALNDGTGKIYNGSKTLATGGKSLFAGARKLSDGVGELYDGTKKLESGAKKLADGITQFDDEAIQKLISAYDGDVKNVVNKLKALEKAGKHYQSFTGLADGKEGTTKFVWRMDGIKAADE